MKSLAIVWQRLVDPTGETCPRCGGTLANLEEALAKLKQSLQPLGIEPTLETREIDRFSFQEDPTQSNRIWIADKPIEEWLSAQSSTSSCCSVCGDSECRMIELGGESFEVIPTELILKAALVAAAQMVLQNDRGEGTACESQCCPDPK